MRTIWGGATRVVKASPVFFFLKLRNLQIVANKNFETKKIKKVPMNENEKRSFNFYLKITKIFEDKYKKQT